MPSLRLASVASVASITTAVLLAAAPRVALAGGDGALDRFQKAHQAPERPSSPAPSNNKDSDDDDTSSSSTSTDDTSSSSSSSSSASVDESTGVPVIVLITCLVPPITFACLMPSHRVAAEPYAAPSLYIEQVEDPDDGELSYRPRDLERVRIIELGLTGFRSLNEDVFSHEMGMTLWLGPVLFHGRWEHLYERIEATGGFDHLDILRTHLGANILGPFVDRIELYMNAGGLFLHGNGDWLAAVDLGGEFRAYPVAPLALRAGSMASLFPIGPVLVDTRLEAGITMGSAEVRAGARFLYQDGAQGFWGPIATVAARF